jgi:hypothetical protein
MRIMPEWLPNLFYKPSWIVLVSHLSPYFTVLHHLLLLSDVEASTCHSFFKEQKNRLSMSAPIF